MVCILAMHHDSTTVLSLLPLYLCTYFWQILSFDSFCSTTFHLDLPATFCFHFNGGFYFTQHYACARPKLMDWKGLSINDFFPIATILKCGGVKLHFHVV